MIGKGLISLPNDTRDPGHHFANGKSGPDGQLEDANDGIRKHAGSLERQFAALSGHLANRFPFATKTSSEEKEIKRG